MKGPIARALAWDAVYQVLDNLVFRIFAWIALIPIAFTFLVGFRENEIVFLFGLKRWSYAGLLKFFGWGPVEDAQGLVLEVLIQLVFDQLAGTVGVLFCIVATAFFVPRMIEKGAADVLFHKPVRRTTLYLSRFFAGLVFVGLLSAVTAAGIYLGLLVVSGYNDPGILFVAASLTYVFGLIYTVCMLFGVLTKSSVAAILLSVIFFLFNGCIHQTWMLFDQEHRPASPDLREEPADADPEPVAEEGLFARSLLLALDALHFVLPKTSDASHLARKLRKAVEASAYDDADSRLVLFEIPAGLEVVAQPFEPEANTGLSSSELLGERRLVLRESTKGLWVTLWRRPARTQESAAGGTKRRREEFSREAADALRDALRERLSSALPTTATRDFGSNSKGGPATSANQLSWIEGESARIALVFKAASTIEGAPNWIYTLWIEGPSDALASGGDEFVDSLDRGFGFEAGPQGYEEQLRLDADWKHNILFSVGSSLAFAVLMLFFGAWRLARLEL